MNVVRNNSRYIACLLRGFHYAAAQAEVRRLVAPPQSLERQYLNAQMGQHHSARGWRPSSIRRCDSRADITWLFYIIQARGFPAWKYALVDDLDPWRRIQSCDIPNPCTVAGIW